MRPICAVIRSKQTGHKNSQIVFDPNGIQVMNTIQQTKYVYPVDQNLFSPQEISAKSGLRVKRMKTLITK